MRIALAVETSFGIPIGIARVPSIPIGIPIGIPGIPGIPMGIPMGIPIGNPMNS